MSPITLLQLEEIALNKKDFVICLLLYNIVNGILVTGEIFLSKQLAEIPLFDGIYFKIHFL